MQELDFQKLNRITKDILLNLQQMDDDASYHQLMFVIRVSRAMLEEFYALEEIKDIVSEATHQIALFKE